MSLEVGPVDKSRREEWWRISRTVFAWEMKDVDLPLYDASIDWDRAWAAYDGGVMVGSAANIRIPVTVPGGAVVPMGGLTAVSVLPTHRRRGALTRMMRASFDDALAHGEPITGLWASESGIYARFGYGVGTSGADLTLSSPHAVMLVEAPSPGRMRLLDADETRRIVPALYESATAGVPGTVHRSEAAWGLYFHDPEHWRGGGSPLNFAVYEREGEPFGYIRYRVKEAWEDAHPRYTVVVGDLQALDADAYAALHRFVFGIDLVETIQFDHRRLGEPLVHLLVEPRRLQRRISDGLWIRVVDVPAALSARRYGTAGSLVIEVVDDFCPWVQGRYLVEGDPEGGSCSPTDREPDVRILAGDLAASYLGDSRIPVLSWLGRVVGDPEAIDLLHRMMAWPLEPLCTVTF